MASRFVEEAVFGKYAGGSVRLIEIGRTLEDTIRFIKQSYDFEDIRVLTYNRLKNMATLVLAASYFAAVWLGTSTKLNILAMHALNAAKRIFGIPDFRYYALADGISAIFKRIGKGRCTQGGKNRHRRISYPSGEKMGELLPIFFLTLPRSCYKFLQIFRSTLSKTA